MLPDQRKVLMVASEAVPFAKTGGLADVVGALPAALTIAGYEVTVLLPKYRSTIPTEDIAGPLTVLGNEVRIQRSTEQPMFHFLQCPALYERESLYGKPADYPDN